MTVGGRPHEHAPLVRWGASSADARLAVLGVHGRGQSPEYLRMLADRVADPALHWAAPAADDGTWYPLPFLEPVERNEPHLSAAVAALQASLAVLAADGFPADRVIVLGFSQGACLLSHLLLTHPDRFAGAAILTGGFPGRDAPAARPAGTFGGMPVVMSIGTDDPFVPLERAAATRDLLATAGAAVRWLPFPGSEHVVVDDAVLAIRTLAAAPTTTTEPHRL